MLRRRRLGAVTLGVATLVAACAGGGAGGGAPPGTGPLVVVSAPLTAQPWIARSEKQGAQLAVETLNATPGRHVTYRLQVLDNAGNPQTAASVARTAVSEHAAALVTDGTGGTAVAAVTDPAHLPVFVVFDGGGSFIDAQRYPTMFRLAPANKYLTRRLADYLAARASSVAVFGDSTQYGQDGVTPLVADLRYDQIKVVNSTVLPQGASDVSAQVLDARHSGAKALVMWAGAGDVAAVIRAVRQTGWDVPIYTGPTGEDPLVRQQLADHPEWVDGLTFVSFRITTEQGPAPFNAFRAAFEHRFGADQVGVSADGRPVIQPPDWAMFPYDAVILLDAALTQDGYATGAPELTALEQVTTTSANGDERGYGPGEREAVSPSDMYFGRFLHMRFAPVTDDLLSTHLPTVAQ